VAVALPKREVPNPKAGDGVEAPKPPKEAPNVVGYVTPNTSVAVPLLKGKFSCLAFMLTNRKSTQVQT
jgi:hypothetical protein